MKKDSGKTVRPSRATYDVLEEMARLKIQEFIQDVFNEEIAEFLGTREIREDQGDRYSQ